jgi:protein-S-isoprenylcysteine O-methyltransferase Ste14
MLSRLIATGTVIAIAVLSLIRYRVLNAHYDKRRPVVPSDTSFAGVYRILIVVLLAIALASYWRGDRALLKLYDSDALRMVGTLLSVLGAVGFEASIRALGTQYSPCFDLRVPTKRVTNGPYRWLAHPMYVSNMVILVGVFVSSGSVLAILIASIVGAYYYRSARSEDRLRARLR